MGYLYTILKEHFKGKFDWAGVVWVFLLGLVVVILQYRFHLVSTPIREYSNALRIPLYWFLYGFLFIGSCAVLWLRKTIPNVFVQKDYWIAVLFIISILAFDHSYFLLSLVKDETFADPALQAAVVSILTYLTSIVSVILPAFLLSKYYALPSFYGLSFGKEAYVKPYWLVLGITLIIVFIGTFSSGISQYYPVYRRSGIYQNAAVLGIPEVLSIGLFESAYAFNFISVELLFRGLFVFTFSRFLGKYAILPMAVCYMVFHLGKPLVETLSSFFGGYILGVFALYSKNIWGGIILHIGTALFMELLASFL